MSYFADLALQHIDGVWRPGSGSWDLVDFDPYTGEKLAAITVATTRETDAAYAAARLAQPAWAATSGFTRREVLERTVRLIEERHAELAEVLTTETGATPARAAFELRQARECLLAAAALAVRPAERMPPSPTEGKDNHVLREPVGVVCAISPFHHPFLRAFATVAPALALGNTVVLKPHQSTPVAGGALLAHLLETAGLPAGALNVVITDIAEIGDALLTHPVPDVIAYAGSERTGREVAAVAAHHFKRAVLDVSGGGPFVVLDDADVPGAAAAAAFSLLVHQGQGGGAPPSRVLVDRAVEREFAEEFAARAGALVAGDPRDPATRIGPLIGPAQAAAAAVLVAQAVAEGASPLVPGGVTGAVMRPTVLTALPETAALPHQEVHGPIALLLPFKNDDEAVTLSADAPYGRAGAVHTADERRGLTLARRLGPGTAQVNGSGIPDEPALGPTAVESFTKVRWLSVQHTRTIFPF